MFSLIWTRIVDLASWIYRVERGRLYLCLQWQRFSKAPSLLFRYLRFWKEHNLIAKLAKLLVELRLRAMSANWRSRGSEHEQLRSRSIQKTTWSGQSTALESSKCATPTSRTSTNSSWTKTWREKRTTRLWEWLSEQQFLSSLATNLFENVSSFSQNLFF